LRKNYYFREAWAYFRSEEGRIDAKVSANESVAKTIEKHPNLSIIRGAMVGTEFFFEHKTAWIGKWMRRSENDANLFLPPSAETQNARIAMPEMPANLKPVLEDYVYTRRTALTAPETSHEKRIILGAKE